jgi:hypothetical protein
MPDPATYGKPHKVGMMAASESVQIRIDVRERLGAPEAWAEESMETPR